jgi:hypothetical protein
MLHDGHHHVHVPASCHGGGKHRACRIRQPWRWGASACRIRQPQGWGAPASVSGSHGSGERRRAGSGSQGGETSSPLLFCSDLER